MIYFSETEKTAKWFNTEMDTSSRLPSLLHILPFPLLQSLGFIASRYMIGMI